MLFCILYSLYEILWHRLRIRCIIVRRGQEETYAFGELVLWKKVLSIAVSERGLLPAF